MNKWETRLLKALFENKKSVLDKETDLQVSNYESSLYKFKQFAVGFVILLPITVLISFLWAEFENRNKIIWFIVSITVINLFSFFLTRMCSYYWLYNITKRKLLKRKDEIQIEILEKEKKKEDKKKQEKQRWREIHSLYLRLNFRMRNKANYEKKYRRKSIRHNKKYKR